MDINWDAWSAIGTIFAAVITFVSVMVSFSLIEHQLKREKEQKSAEEQRQRSDQASYVAVWYDHRARSIVVDNQSRQPIYDAYATLVNHASDQPSYAPEFAGMLRIVPPRERIEVLIEDGWQGAHFVPGAALTFRDSQSITWQRTHRGHLQELPEDVFQHYGLSQPATYVSDPVQIF